MKMFQELIKRQILNVMGWHHTIDPIPKVTNANAENLSRTMAMGNRVEQLPKELDSAFPNSYVGIDEQARFLDKPVCRKSTWPRNAPFALFLSEKSEFRFQ